MGGKALQGERLPREEAVEVWKWLFSELRTVPSSKITLAGSYRRGKATLGDIEVVIESDDPSLPERLRSLGFSGGEKQLKMLYKGHQIDLYISPSHCIGAMLLHCTGSANFNPWLRGIAKAKGFKLNQWGLWDLDYFVAGKTEEEIFSVLGMQYIRPQDREMPEQKPVITTSDKIFYIQGTQLYTVRLKNGYWSCSCPHFRFRKVECKHIIACKEK